MEKYITINAAGCSIRAKLCAADTKDIDSVILFGHGFGGHKDNRAAARFAERVLSKNRGAALVTFDWPCHGDDVRRLLRLADCDTYLREVIAFIREKYGDPTLYAYATSFGGYLFLKYISEHGSPFAKTALRCPAIDMYDVIDSSIMTDENREKIRKGKAVQVGFDRKVEIDREFMESLKREDISGRDFLPWADDMLILHGTADEIVPIDTAREFAERNVIEFVPIEGADHRFRDNARMERANALILPFFGMK